MTAYKSKAIVRSLTKKGFVLINKHHKYLCQHIDGVETGIWTKVSQGDNFDVDENILHQMAKQLKLSYQDFRQLVECPLSEEDYIELLREKGEIEDS